MRVLKDIKKGLGHIVISKGLQSQLSYQVIGGR